MKYNRVISFGDSFTWGTDLADCTEDRTTHNKYNDGYSKKTWPALIAQNLNTKYLSLAIGGSSNQQILRWILFNIIEDNIDSNDLLIINWTWMDRFDLFDTTIESLSFKEGTDKGWVTVRPGDSNDYSELYFKHIHSELWAKFESLKTISVALDILNHYNIPNIMTCIDKTIIDQQFFNPEYVDLLINRVSPVLLWFEGQGFYNWAIDSGFPIGKTGHPLEEAHRAAFDYITKHYEFT